MREGSGCEIMGQKYGFVDFATTLKQLYFNVNWQSH